MFVAKLDESNDVVVVRDISDGRELSANWYEVSQAVFDEVTAGGRFFPGTSTPRWAYDPTTEALTENVDGRPTGTWSQTLVKLGVGDAPMTVQLALSIPLNDAERFVKLRGVWWMDLVFVEGVADVVIRTEKPTWLTLDVHEDFRLTNALEIRIVDNGIRPEN